MRKCGARRRSVLRGVFVALGDRDYRGLWLAYGDSALGSYAASLAELVLILSLTHGNPEVLGIKSALFTGPMLLLGVWTGMLAETRSQRAILAVTNTVWAIPELWLAWEVATGELRWWYILVATGLRGVVNAFDVPARNGLMIGLAPPDLRDEAVALSSLLSPVCQVAGFALAGLLVERSTVLRAGVAACMMFNAFSCLLVPAALAAGTKQPARAGSTAAALGGARQAWAHVRATRQIWRPLLALMATVIFALNIPVFAARLAPSPGAFTVLSGASAAGALAGGLAASALARGGLGRRAAVAAAGIGVGELVAAQPDPLAWRIVVLAGVGACSAIFAACVRAMVLDVDPGRPAFVGALVGMAQLGAATVGAPLAGLITSWSVVAALRIGGIAALAAAVLVAVTLRLPAGRPMDGLTLSDRERAITDCVRTVAEDGVPGTIVWVGSGADPGLMLTAARAESERFPAVGDTLVYAFVHQVTKELRATMARFEARRGAGRRPFVKLTTKPQAISELGRGHTQIKLVMVSGELPWELIGRISVGATVICFDNIPMGGPPAIHQLFGHGETPRLEPLVPGTADLYFRVTKLVHKQLRAHAQRLLTDRFLRSSVVDALVDLAGPERRPVAVADIARRAAEPYLALMRDGVAMSVLSPNRIYTLPEAQVARLLAGLVDSHLCKQVGDRYCPGLAMSSLYGRTARLDRAQPGLEVPRWRALIPWRALAGWPRHPRGWRSHRPPQS